MMQIIRAALELVSGFIAYLREKRLLDAGAAEAAAKGQKESEHAINEANAARDRVRSDVAANPDSVRQPKEFDRPE